MKPERFEGLIKTKSLKIWEYGLVKVFYTMQKSIYTNPSMDKFVDTEHRQVTQALSSDSQYQGKSQECYTRDMKVLYTIQVSWMWILKSSAKLCYLYKVATKMLDYQHTPSGLDLRNIGTFNHTTQDAGKVEVTATATTFPLQFPVPTKSISSKDGKKKK